MPNFAEQTILTGDNLGILILGPVPDDIEPGAGLAAGRERQQAPGPGESDIVLAHVVEGGDAVGGLARALSSVGQERPSHRIHLPVVEVQGPDHHHIPLQPLGPVDGGYRHLGLSPSPFRSRPGTGNAGGNASLLQAVQVAANHLLPDAVQQQRRLGVVGYDSVALQKPQQTDQLVHLRKAGEQVQSSPARASTFPRFAPFIDANGRNRLVTVIQGTPNSVLLGDMQDAAVLGLRSPIAHLIKGEKRTLGLHAGHLIAFIDTDDYAFGAVERG